jgi:hypothetical protein
MPIKFDADLQAQLSPSRASASNPYSGVPRRNAHVSPSPGLHDVRAPPVPPSGRTQRSHGPGALIASASPLCKEGWCFPPFQLTELDEKILFDIEVRLKNLSWLIADQPYVHLINFQLLTHA